MGRADAEVRVSADASEVERAAAAAKNSWTAASRALAESFGSAARGVITDLGNVALAAGRVNFASQHQQVKDFEAATARMAVATGRGLEDVRQQTEALGVSIGKRPQEVMAWENAVGRLSYNFKSAHEAMRSMSALAATTGRTVEDYQGLAVQFEQMGVEGRDVSGVLGTMKAQAEQFGTAGGVAALADQFEAAGDAVSRFADRGSVGIKRVTGFLAEMGRGLDEVSARRVGQQALGMLSSDPLRWERYLGKQVIDEHGKVADPAQTYKAIYEKASQRFSGSALRYAMIRNFGPELGMAVMNAGKSGRFDEVDKMVSARPSTDIAAAQNRYLSTDAGKRDVAEAELARSARDLLGSSSRLGRAADALQQFSAHNPIASTFAASMLGNAANGVMGGIGKAVSGSGLLRGGGSLARMAGGAGALAAAGLLGYEVGSWIDEKTGASDWISGTGRHSRVKADSDRADIAADAALMNRVRSIKETNAILRSTSVEGTDRASLVNAAASLNVRGEAVSGTSLQSELVKSGMKPEDAARLGKEFATAAGSSMKFTIINATGGPVNVVNDSSKSASAGGQ